MISSNATAGSPPVSLGDRAYPSRPAATLQHGHPPGDTAASCRPPVGLSHFVAPARTPPGPTRRDTAASCRPPVGLSHFVAPARTPPGPTRRDTAATCRLPSG